MKTKQIVEGRIKLKVPVTKIPEQGLVFYNPEMTLNRDISVSVLQVYQKMRGEKLRVLDLLSATGIRALRYKAEVKGLKKVVANDIDPKAVKMIKSNAKLSKVKIEITKENANLFLNQNQKQFDFIDVDPFGPPVYYLENTARSLEKHGFAAFTATDTAALCGVYPSTSLRKYGVKSIRGAVQKELAARIMITSIVKSMARFAVGFIPVLTHSTRHYFRVYGVCKRAKTHADEVLKNLDYYSECLHCGVHEWGLWQQCANCQQKMQITGPIWSGPLSDKKFCESVFNELYSRTYMQQQNEAMKLLKLLITEADAPSFYYDIHWLARKYKWKQLPTMEKIIEKLRSSGFKAVRTHFSETAIKTDAPLSRINELAK